MPFPFREVVNAATMVPGIFLAMDAFNRLPRRGRPDVKWAARRAALVSTPILYAFSMMFHLVDANDRSKERGFLRADLFAQQFSALATIVATRSDTPKRRKMRTTVAGLMLLSLAAWRTSRLQGDDPTGLASTLALQAAVILFADGAPLGVASSRWAAPFLLRLVHEVVPNDWTHGLFHMAVWRAFHSIWSSWID